MQTILEGIAARARREKSHRFQAVYRILNEENLAECFRELNKNAAVGIDGVSYRAYEEKVTENIRALVERLKRKAYHAKGVRRVYIAKRDGGERALGIPAIEDKLVQYAAAKLLQAMYEGEFLESSHGYRPGRSAHSAIHALQRTLQFGRYEVVVEADIKDFFGTIEHERMGKMIEEKVDDRAFVRLIKKWLKAGIMEEDGEVKHPTTGTPQGGVISPILANIYMHKVLNLWFEEHIKKESKGEAYLCVYADDFVAAFEHKEDAERFYGELDERLGKYNLKVAKEKTRMIRFSREEIEKNGVFEFLGFEFRWVLSRKGTRWVRRRTSKERLRKSIHNLVSWIQEKRHTPTKMFFKALNAKLRGYYNYYGVIGNFERIHLFYWHVTRALYKWWNRRSERVSKNWQEFLQVVRDMRLEKPRIREVAT